MLSLTVKCKEGSFAVVLMTADPNLIMRDIGVCDNLPSLLPTPKRNSLDRKPVNRILKNCDRDPSQLIVSGRSEGRVWSLEVWACSSEYMNNTISFLFFFFLWGSHKGEWTGEDWEVSVIRMHCMKFTNTHIKILCWRKKEKIQCRTNNCNVPTMVENSRNIFISEWKRS